MNVLHKSFAFSKDKYFLILHNACIYNLLYDRLSVDSLKVKRLSIVVPSKTAFLLSSITVEFSINLIGFRFFFSKIMNWNLHGLVSKEFILNHVNEIFISCFRFSINQSIIYTDSSSKEVLDFFNILTGISPPSALFVGRSLTIAFISSVVASLNEKMGQWSI